MSFLLALSVLATAQVNVYTRSYDNARTGANLQEIILTPANVSAATFGKPFTVHTDGEIYAQPLYVSNLAIAGGTHNVVFVATMFNSVYAIDADTGAVLWTKNFGSPIIPQDVEVDQNISWATKIGIIGTPVIDPATNTMYFVSSYQPADGTQTFGFNLNAIDITTGLPVGASPVAIAATYSTADLTSPLVLRAQVHNPRPGMALGNGNVYIAFASHDDRGPYHGFVLAYSASTLAQTAVYSDTTVGYQGGIWCAGQAPTLDSAGNIYISTGNGSFGTTPNNLTQTGNSFIKLSPSLQLLDYFTPYNSAAMNAGDSDLGSSGLLLIPKTTYLLGGGKQGILYLSDTTGMGGFNASTDQVRQEFQAVYGQGTSHIHGGPVYFDSAVNGPSVFNWGENDVLRAFAFNATTGLITTTPFAKGDLQAPVTNHDGAMPGGFLSISANGNSNGILWASTPFNGDAAHQSIEGTVYAYDANTLNLLWNDKTNEPRDEIGLFAKYVPPVVANGKVYLPNFGPVGTTDGSGNLVVYGLLLPQLTVAVANANMNQGAALPTLTGTVTGLVNGDTVGTTIVVTYSTTATSKSPAGTYPITATVTGSSAGNYAVDVTSGTLTIAATPVLTITANNAARAYGAANPVFTGTVTGAQGSDTFTESFATTAIVSSNVGTYPIVPSVAGTNLANYTVTPVNGTLTVSGAATTTTLAAPATAADGASVTLTATVASTAGTPAGTVTFNNGSTVLSTGTLSGGVASLSITTLPVGTDSVTASYAAAGNYAASTSPAVTVTISPALTPGYAVTASPTALTIAAGHSGSTTLTVTSSGGYTGTIAWNCTGLPSNASYSFAQNQVSLSAGTQSASTVMTINTTAQQAQSKPTPSPLLALAFWWPGSLTGLALFARRRELASLFVLAVGLAGCGGGSMSGGGSTAPVTSQLTLTATGTAGTVVTTKTITLTLTMSPIDNP